MSTNICGLRSTKGNQLLCPCTMLSSPPNAANRRSLSWRPLEEPLVAQPVEAVPGPGRAGMIDVTHTEVVGSPRIDMQLRWNAGALQGQVHDHAVFRRADEVGPAVREEDRGRTGRDAQAGGEFLLVLGLQVARIGRDGEVRSAADLVDVVERLVGPFLKARCRGDRQVSPRRETNHADSLGIDAPPPGSAAYQADGSLGILERPPRRLALGLVGTSWYPILEDDSRHALRSEPGCDLFTFQFPEEVPVAAPGTDQDRGSRIL